MEDYQTRLLEEARTLSGKLNKLNDFISGKRFPMLPRRKKDLLYEQQRCMSLYIQILGKRLELEGVIFTQKEES